MNDEFMKNLVPPKKSQIKRLVLYFGVVVFGAYAISYGFNSYRDALIPPLSGMKASYVWVADPKTPVTTLRHGQEFVIRTYTSRLEECTVETQYSLMRFTKEEGITLRTVFYTWPLSTNRALKGETITDKHLILPETIQPGDYVLTRQSTYDCNREHIFQAGLPLAVHIE
jgi:hypothetical protein